MQDRALASTFVRRHAAAVKQLHVGSVETIVSKIASMIDSATLCKMTDDVSD
jgi:hypothetical protein